MSMSKPELIESETTKIFLSDPMLQHLLDLYSRRLITTELLIERIEKLLEMAHATVVKLFDRGNA